MAEGSCQLGAREVKRANNLEKNIMSTYKSEEVTLKASAETVYAKLSNPENLKNLLENVPSDRIPEDKRALYDQMKIEDDSITFPGGPAGSIKLQVGKRVEPKLIELKGVGTPVEMSIMLHIMPESDIACSAMVELDINIPMMLKPMIGGTLQKMVEQFAQVLCMIPFDR